MQIRILVVGLAVAGFVQTANATPFLSSSLPDLNKTSGAGVATTTTDATGRSTTVVGPAGSSNQVSATPALNTWQQSGVGAGATVGITTAYPKDGNGSAFFSTVSSDSKADLEYYFSPVAGGYALASLTAMDFQFYRNDTSTAPATLAPVMRLDIAKDGKFAGSLVLENVYQAQQNAPVDSWTDLMATLNTGIFWATNAVLGPTLANANGGQKTLAAWIADNSGSTLSVFGMSVGVGSGWNGTFSGGVDDVSIAFAGGPVVSSNFEVTPAATVPEPASLALLLLGVGATALRRRHRVG